MYPHSRPRWEIRERDRQRERERGREAGKIDSQADNADGRSVNHKFTRIHLFFHRAGTSPILYFDIYCSFLITLCDVSCDVLQYPAISFILVYLRLWTITSATFIHSFIHSSSLRIDYWFLTSKGSHNDAFQSAFIINGSTIVLVEKKKKKIEKNMQRSVRNCNVGVYKGRERDKKTTFSSGRVLKKKFIKRESLIGWVYLAYIHSLTLTHTHIHKTLPHSSLSTRRRAKRFPGW